MSESYTTLKQRMFQEQLELQDLVKRRDNSRRHLDSKLGMLAALNAKLATYNEDVVQARIAKFPTDEAIAVFRRDECIKEIEKLELEIIKWRRFADMLSGRVNKIKFAKIPC